PPGRKTRLASDMALIVSGGNMKPQRQLTTSKLSSAKSSDSISMTRASRLAMPISAARKPITSIISGERSVATTPDGATVSAIVKAGWPAPDARSKTSNPGRSPAASHIHAVTGALQLVKKSNCLSQPDATLLQLAPPDTHQSFRQPDRF